MRYLPRRMRAVRFLLVCAAVAGVGLGAAATVGALVGYPTDSVTVYTGCLSNNGTAAGQLTNVAANSLSPTKPCSTQQLVVHLSGGTITKVTAGTGLTGGGSNGYVTLGLDPAYSLPQGCSSGAIPDWFGSAWQCFAAGTGLNTDTTAKTIGIASSFQLPQSGCQSGQFVASDGSGGWSCQSQKSYSGADFALSSQSCDAGQFMTGIDSTGKRTCGNDQTYSGANFALSKQDCTSGQFTTGIDGSGNLKCATPTSNVTNNIFHSKAFLFNQNSCSGCRGNVEITHITVPSGTYFIAARAEVINNDSDSQDATCFLSTGDSEILTLAAQGNPGWVAEFPLQDIATFNTNTQISLSCNVFNGAPGGEIAAIQVGTDQGNDLIP